MNPNVAVLLKSLKPAIMAKAIKTFDRHAMLMISVCWAVTIVVMFIALYTINLSVTAKKEAQAALATEPVLPKIIRSGVGGKELQAMLDRLQRRYPEIRVTWQNNVLSIAGANGGVYHQWLTAIGQVDTLYPQYHWKIQSMCVGKICTGNDIMVIDLAGEKIAFEMPQIDVKD